MKSLSKAALSRHRKLRLAKLLAPDLFDVARQRQLRENLAVRHLVCRYGLAPSVAAVVAEHAGMGGARDA
jgi:hypothetical protein